MAMTRQLGLFDQGRKDGMEDPGPPHAKLQTPRVDSPDMISATGLAPVTSGNCADRVESTGVGIGYLPMPRNRNGESDRKSPVKTPREVAGGNSVELNQQPEYPVSGVTHARRSLAMAVTPKPDPSAPRKTGNLKDQKKRRGSGAAAPKKRGLPPLTPIFRASGLRFKGKLPEANGLSGDLGVILTGAVAVGLLIVAIGLSRGLYWKLTH